jgi:general L-amino acid transport system substrate-binding protein
MRKHLLVLLSVILAFSVVLTGCFSSEAEPTSAKEENKSAAPAAPAKKSMLETVKNRGKLVAGVNAKLPGFGYVGSDGTYTGFDVDFARAVAAAVFGDPNKVDFRPLSAQERFTALQTGEVDVLIRNTTWTSSRDTSVGLNFAPTTFYDGQGIMVLKDSGINSLKDLEGARIGVQSGTTTELNLADQLRKAGVTYESVVYEDSDALVAAYEQGTVDAWTTDKSGLISRQAVMADPKAHKVLKESLSKEPLGPAVLHGDDQWFDIVKWVVNVTIEAEELGITKDNIDSFMNSEDPVVRRLLGLEGEVGKEIGLSNDFAIQVIKAVGNYGEIYNRHLGPDTIFGLERGLNDLWTNGGLLYSPPFR